VNRYEEGRMRSHNTVATGSMSFTISGLSFERTPSGLLGMYPRLYSSARTHTCRRDASYTVEWTNRK